MFTTQAAKDAVAMISIDFWATDENNHYVVDLFPTAGKYEIARTKNGKNLYQAPLTEDSSIVKGTNTTNEVSVVVNGKSGSLRVNGKKVIDFTGAPPEGGSLFGFQLGTAKENPATITLKSIQLREVETAQQSGESDQHQPGETAQAQPPAPIQQQSTEPTKPKPLAGSEQSPATTPQPLPAVSSKQAQATDIGDCPSQTLGLDKGKIYACACPAVEKAGKISGSQIYTWKSDVCTAAVHAGVIKAKGGGSVMLRIVDSPDMFKGTTQNGITSGLFAHGHDVPSAFQFVPAEQ